MGSSGKHEKFMRRCIQLASQAKAQGKFAVGSVIVIEGKIVGEGIEQFATGNMLTGHAEVLASQQAIDSLNARRLYTALSSHALCVLT